MDGPPLIWFDDDGEPAAAASRASVGGKGLSLIRMARAGLPVPHGGVLTAAFFDAWFEKIHDTDAWRALAGAGPDDWPRWCAEVKDLARSLEVTPYQRRALDELREGLAASADGAAAALFAVRSSSPEEDTASASFAGAYETRLGVGPSDLEDAVRDCFASALDHRVLVYKRERGFDALSPRIAVVVQRQIASDIAGVAFSLNPVTNDYDEAVIDANVGLGTTVVDGSASPDHFVVDRTTGRAKQITRGAKQVSLHLRDGGEVEERREERAQETTLTDAQVEELADALARVERLFDEPVDVEWACADGRLCILQARPITTYVPVPAEIRTAPGERRLLYQDIGLSGGMTINAPISPLSLDFMQDMIRGLAETYVGRVKMELSFDDRLWFFAGARGYQNLSAALWLAGPRRMAKSAALADALTAEIVGAIDVERYRTPRRPPWARLGMIRYAPRFMWRVAPVCARMTWAMLAPRRARRRMRERLIHYRRNVVGGVDESLPLAEFRRAYPAPILTRVMNDTMSILCAALAAQSALARIVPRKTDEERGLADELKLGFEGNVVVEMGVALHRLAHHLKPSDLADLGALAERIESRDMPQDFLRLWDEFVTEYGQRGPSEGDIANPRYADDPRVALRQIADMVGAGEESAFDPARAHQQRIERRREAFEELMRRSGPLRRILMRWAHRVVDALAGERDTPKHEFLRIHVVVRRRVLREGRRLAEQGRLDAPEDVFGLTFDDLEGANEEPSLDLRALRAQRMAFYRLLESRVRSFPLVIDSRGRILRPPKRPERPGELTGRGVSSGVARGPVKVLNSPHEKRVEPGDVLVAYATDPGWTPLFVNAAAIVLEVGGVLQHGVVVAREYGKPCVAGVDRVMTRLRDGQQVEVDGTRGVVRVVEG